MGYCRLFVNTVDMDIKDLLLCSHEEDCVYWINCTTSQSSLPTPSVTVLSPLCKLFSQSFLQTMRQMPTMDTAILHNLLFRLQLPSALDPLHFLVQSHSPVVSSNQPSKPARLKHLVLTTLLDTLLTCLSSRLATTSPSIFDNIIVFISSLKYF